MKLFSTVNGSIIAEEKIRNTIFHDCILDTSFETRVSLFHKKLSVHNSPGMVIDYGDKIGLFTFFCVFRIRQVKRVLRICLPTIVWCIMFKLTEFLLYRTVKVLFTSTHFLKISGQSSRFQYSDWNYFLQLKNANDLFHTPTSQFLSKFNCSFQHFRIVVL